MKVKDKNRLAEWMGWVKYCSNPMPGARPDETYCMLEVVE